VICTACFTILPLLISTWDQRAIVRPYCRYNCPHISHSWQKYTNKINFITFPFGLEECQASPLTRKQLPTKLSWLLACPIGKDLTKQVHRQPQWEVSKIKTTDSSSVESEPYGRTTMIKPKIHPTSSAPWHFWVNCAVGGLWLGWRHEKESTYVRKNQKKKFSSVEQFHIPNKI